MMLWESGLFMSTKVRTTSVIVPEPGGAMAAHGACPIAGRKTAQSTVKSAGDYELQVKAKRGNSLERGVLPASARPSRPRFLSLYTYYYPANTTFLYLIPNRSPKRTRICL